MKIVNFTPHVVKVFREDGSVVEIQPDGRVFRLEEDDEPAKFTVAGAEVVYRRFRCPDEIPEEFYDHDCVVIVSLPALQALAQTGVSFPALVVAPDTGKGAVRDAEGRIVGTKRFITCPQL